jgi:hypothetical protein
MAQLNYSTYAQIILGLSGIASLVLKHSRQSTAKQISILPITLLTDLQVAQALSHPQNDSLKNLIATAYRDTVEATHNINNSTDSLETQRIFIEETLKTLQAKLGPDISPASKASIESTKDVLNQQLRVIQSIANNSTINSNELNQIKQDIDQVAAVHDTEWTAYREKQLEQLKDRLEKILSAAGLRLLPGEIDNLLRQDMQEVLDRYVDLGVSKDLPAGKLDKLLGLNNPDFDTFYKMKAYMAIRSANPTPDQAISLLKELDSFFASTKTEANELNQKQLAENSRLHQQAKPIVKSAKSSFSELKKLEQERSLLLTRVATIHDLESIRERIEQRVEVKPQTGLTR